MSDEIHYDRHVQQREQADREAQTPHHRMRKAIAEGNERAYEKAQSELSPAHGSDKPPSLFVEVRLYNQPGIYRVLTIGGDGQKDSDMDAARLLRKLAHWIETGKGKEAP